MLRNNINFAGIKKGEGLNIESQGSDLEGHYEQLLFFDFKNS